jgi:hypothetical protein
VLTRKASTYFWRLRWGTKDLVAKTVQSDLSQMGARCDLDMNNIVTASLEDLPLEEQQKFKALQEYMRVQFLLTSRRIDPTR